MPAERNYGQVEKEALALIFVEFFEEISQDVIQVQLYTPDWPQAIIVNI